LCEGKLTYLSSRITLRHTAIKPTLGYGCSGTFDFDQRLQTTLHHPVADDTEDHQYSSTYTSLQKEQ